MGQQCHINWAKMSLDSRQYYMPSSCSNTNMCRLVLRFKTYAPGLPWLSKPILTFWEIRLSLAPPMECLFGVLVWSAGYLTFRTANDHRDLNFRPLRARAAPISALEQLDVRSLATTWTAAHARARPWSFPEWMKTDIKMEVWGGGGGNAVNWQTCRNRLHSLTNNLWIENKPVEIDYMDKFCPESGSTWTQTFLLLYR